MSSNDAWVADAARALAEGDAGRDRETLFVVVGPTASGKTELAIHLAEALEGEIVNVDSVQIYKHFDIGSGKPTREEQTRAPHHLIDVLDPLEPMEAARFRLLADDAISDIRARGKRPILSGGTFLWHRAVLYGLADAPPGDATIRARHREVAEREGRPALHLQLKAVDEVAAGRLHPNDLVRVSRALEVYELTGKRMSELQAEHGFRMERYRAKLVGLKHEDAVLKERIERRAASWLDHGWLEEVESLIARGYANARAMDSVGYHEVAAHLRGELPRSELLTRIVQATRTFVRRQRTWLARADVSWLAPP